MALVGAQPAKWAHRGGATARSRSERTTMQPVIFTLIVTRVMPLGVILEVHPENSVEPAELSLTHDEYIGLCAALEVGAAQSSGLFTLCHDNAKWLVWRRRQESGCSDTPRPLKTPPRANCGPRRAIPAKPQTHRGHK